MSHNDGEQKRCRNSLIVLTTTRYTSQASFSIHFATNKDVSKWPKYFVHWDRQKS